MGTATIVSESGGGLYTIEFDYGTARLSERLAALEAEIAALVEPIIDADARLEELETQEEATYVAAIDEAQKAYVDAVNERCTQEGWAVDPVAAEYADLKYWWEGVANWREEVSLATQLVGSLEQSEADLAQQLDAAGSALDDQLSLVNSLLAARDNAYADYLYTKFLCENVQNDYSYECYQEKYEEYLYANFEYNYQSLVVLPQVQNEYDEVESALASVQAQLDVAASELAADEVSLENAKEELQAASDAYKQAVLDAREELELCNPLQFFDEIAAINTAMDALAEWRNELDHARADLALLQAQLSSLELQQDYLTVVVADSLTERMNAWCADYTEGVEGEVATLEIPGEPQAVNIAPQFGGPWTYEGDAMLLSREVMSPAQAFFNAAVLPGWQRWMPTYRVGTITAIDYDLDTASVTLDPATSTAQGLNVNRDEWQLADIPVNYMSCNARAFLIGDRVVVQAYEQTWWYTDHTWRVIGFESNPVGCPYEALYPELNHRADWGVTRYCEGEEWFGWEENSRIVFNNKYLGQEIVLVTGDGSADLGDCPTIPVLVQGGWWSIGYDKFVRWTVDAAGCCDTRTGGISYEITPFPTIPEEIRAGIPESFDYRGWRYVFNGMYGPSGAIKYVLDGRAEAAE